MLKLVVVGYGPPPPPPPPPPLPQPISKLDVSTAQPRAQTACVRPEARILIRAGPRTNQPDTNTTLHKPKAVPKVARGNSVDATPAVRVTEGVSVSVAVCGPAPLTSTCAGLIEHV